MLTVRSTGISLRQLRPGDERLFYAVCRYRSEHPEYAACLGLVSDQLAADEGQDYMEGQPAVRRFVASHEGELGILTVEGNAVTVDAHRLGGDIAFLGMEYLSELGYGSATVTLNEPSGTRTYTVAPLPEQPSPGPLSIPSRATYVT